MTLKLLVFLMLAAMIDFSGRCKAQKKTGLRCTIHPCEHQVGEVKIFFSLNFVFQFTLHTLAECFKVLTEVSKSRATTDRLIRELYNVC